MRTADIVQGEQKRSQGANVKIITKAIEDIKPYPNNPRKNDAAVDAVAKSIEEFGFLVPIVIDKNGVIAAGHTRYKAARQQRRPEKASPEIERQVKEIMAQKAKMPKNKIPKKLRNMTEDDVRKMLTAPIID